MVHLRKCHSQNRRWIQPKGFDTGIQIYNPITRCNTPFILPNPHFTCWYTCGPTVYDSAHIGHASTYIRVDILQRILRKYFKINLVTAMNITDIDDKIISRSIDKKIPWEEIPNKYEEEFWQDLSKLNVVEPDIKVRVSKSMHLIVAFIQKILDSGFAYKSPDGSIYFKTTSYNNYGKLQKISKQETTTVENKHQNADFALWKAAKPGEPFWASPWSPGRPGWHIECSAMASNIFGSTIDIHAGGLDLRFPHHENEEAQSCVHHETEQWVNYWIHTGQLSLSGQEHKMSKSLKNTISIEDFLLKYTPDEFRFLCMLTRYRTGMEFGPDTMKIATSVLNKFTSFIDDTRAYINGIKPTTDFSGHDLLKLKCETEEKCLDYFKDDFNTPKVVEALLHLVAKTSQAINNTNVSTSTITASNITIIQDIQNFIRNYLVNLGFQLERTKYSRNHQNTTIDSEKIIDFIVDIRKKIREQAIEQKNKVLFELCDTIRDQLKKDNVLIKDHGKNSSWSYKS